MMTPCRTFIRQDDALKNIHMTKQQSIGFVHVLSRINFLMAPCCEKLEVTPFSCVTNIVGT